MNTLAAGGEEFAGGVGLVLALAALALAVFWLLFPILVLNALSRLQKTADKIALHSEGVTVRLDQVIELLRKPPWMAITPAAKPTLDGPQLREGKYYYS